MAARIGCSRDGAALCQLRPNPTAATDKPTVDTSVGTQPDIVVTAQKRVERLQDVPAAVSVVNTKALTESNRSRLRDFAASVPGFQASPSPGGGGQQTLVIRGITSGTIQNPTVGADQKRHHGASSDGIPRMKYAVIPVPWQP